ncbi:MAG: sigma-54-dependent Fis family transcriptional regulator [bacterium]|nr:sigma-54-dependent Fis family transcriptional regulator [bacterium]
MAKRILLADDDDSLRRVVQFKLEKRGYDVTTVVDGFEALEKLSAHRYDLLLSDIKMPRVDGIELLGRSRKSQPDLKVILITAHATVSQAVQAVKAGAFDYITKPFEDDDLFFAIEKALAFDRLEQENRRLKKRLRQAQKPHGLIGVSPPFKEMMELVDKIAGSEATVLLTGKSGTGKELIARTIHERSGRAEGPFVAINCAAIPKDLIESELFGHVKGAFTGAVRDKKGKFELAEGGTLLLDEIGELAIELQPKLLRVLQERTFEPVGSERSKTVDVRVLAATNLDLQKRVAEERFREDLFYRLNVIPIQVPSLAERSSDIPALVKAFVHKFAPEEDVSVSAEFMDALTNYHWPGNVRELENLIERLTIIGIGNKLRVTDLPSEFRLDAPRPDFPAGSARGTEGLQQLEVRAIREALLECGGNQTKAARRLKIPRHVLVYRMKKWDITSP